MRTGLITGALWVVSSCISLAHGADLAIVGATVLPVSAPPIEGGTVLVSDGKIVAVGPDVVVPEGTEILDASGGFLMPGIIDVHSHMGVYAWPSARAHGDGNEAIDPVTARVRAEDSVHVSDPAFSRARAGGVTTVQILPGSANLVGGESSILKLRPSRTLEKMRFVGAPRGIKMACGENPKRVYGDDIHGPSTRMGSLASMRAAFQSAKDYRKARSTHRDPPPTDANLRPSSTSWTGRFDSMCTATGTTTSRESTG